MRLILLNLGLLAHTHWAIGAVQTFDANSALTVGTNYDAGAGAVPTSTTDILFNTGYPGATAIFQLGTGATATSLSAQSVSSLNLNPITIGNNSSNASPSNAVLTLGNGAGQSNGVSGASASDLIYVGGTTSALNIQRANLLNGQATGTGVLDITLAQTGNFNVAAPAGVLLIQSNITGGFAVNKTGSGYLEFRGTTAGITNFAVKAGTVATTASGSQLGTGVITLGDSTGSASATLLASSSINNNIIVQANATAGTLTLGQNSVGAVFPGSTSTPGNSITYSGNIALDNDVTLVMLRGANRTTTLSGQITGSATITSDGNNNSNVESVAITGTNTTSFTGDVVITGRYLGFNLNSLGQNSTGGTITFAGGNSTETAGLVWRAGNTQDVSSRFVALADNNNAVLNVQSNNVTFAATNGLAGGTTTAFSKLNQYGSGTPTVSDGTLTLAAANSFSGTYTPATTGGTTILAHSNALQNATIAIQAGTTVGGISFAQSVGSHAFTIGNLTGAGNLSLLDNAGSPNAVALTVGGNNGSPAAYSGTMSGAGSLIKTGTGTLTLSGANTYAGATTVSSGTLKAGVASVANTSGAFGKNSAITMANASGATLDITGFNTQVGSLTGGGATGGNVSLGSATLTIGGDNTSPAAYAGVISGSGALNKIGTGTQVLTAANTYAGTTAVTLGTLIINGAQTSATGAVSVAAGATLGGNGTMGTSTTTLTTAGIASVMSPGDGGAGKLTLGGAANFASGATLNMGLGSALTQGTTYDWFAIGGAITGSTAASGLQFDFSNIGGAAQAGVAYRILTFGSISASTFTESDLAMINSAGFVLDTSFDSNGWKINATSLDVQFSAVPEPTTTLLLAFALTTVMALRRRTR